MEIAPITRRRFLAAAGAAASIPVTGHLAWARGAQTGGEAQAGGVAPAGRAGFRIAHFTDIHVQPELRANDGLIAALAHAQSLSRKPDLLLTGGDLVMDTFDQGFDRSKLLWDLWTEILKDHCSLPRVHTLGNHDIWGWNKKKSGTTGQEARWGKRWALEALGLERPYYASEHGGWRIIVLDSVFPEGDGYIGRFDDEQVSWLKGELARDGRTPTLVVSHIPIMSVCAFTGDGKTQEKQHTVSVSNLHADAVATHRLLSGAGNVKLCLSGHIHRLDRVELDGVTYICDGAVCGSWWKGKKDRCDEGYGVVDLHADGTFEHRYVTYGWKAEGL